MVGRWDDGEMGIWGGGGDPVMGRWVMGRWGDGEVGVMGWWGDGEMG